MAQIVMKKKTEKDSDRGGRGAVALPPLFEGRGWLQLNWSLCSLIDTSDMGSSIMTQDTIWKVK